MFPPLVLTTANGHWFCFLACQSRTCPAFYRKTSLRQAAASPKSNVTLVASLIARTIQLKMQIVNGNCSGAVTRRRRSPCCFANSEPPSRAPSWLRPHAIAPRPCAPNCHSARGGAYVHKYCLRARRARLFDESLIYSGRHRSKVVVLPPWQCQA